MAGAMFSPQAGMRISIKAQGSRLDPILFAYLRRPDDASHTLFRVRGATARWWEGLFSPAIGKRWATREAPPFKTSGSDRGPVPTFETATSRSCGRARSDSCHCSRVPGPTLCFGQVIARRKLTD